jgi:hypothetical protein
MPKHLPERLLEARNREQRCQRWAAGYDAGRRRWRSERACRRALPCYRISDTSRVIPVSATLSCTGGQPAHKEPIRDILQKTRNMSGALSRVAAAASHKHDKQKKTTKSTVHKSKTTSGRRAPRHAERAAALLVPPHRPLLLPEPPVPGTRLKVDATRDRRQHLAERQQRLVRRGLRTPRSAA